MKNARLFKASAALWAVALLMTMAPAAWAELNVSAQLCGVGESTSYAFVRVTVSNPETTRMNFRLGFQQAYGNNGSIEMGRGELEPLAQRTFDLAVPLCRAGRVFVVDQWGRRSETWVASDERPYLNICALENFATESQQVAFTQRVTGKSSASSSDIILTQLEPRTLPERWLCYTAFVIICIHEPAWLSLSPEQRGALMQYVRAGGDLVVYGCGRENVETHLLGRIRFTGANPLFTQQRDRELQPPSRNIRDVLNVSQFPYRPEGGGGRWGAFVLATVFCLVAGPLNYAYWSRRRRIRMLMISVPVISLAFCLVIIGYFVASQGFARRGGTFSVTLLDEQNKAALTLSRHALWSGLYPLGGFRFSAQTAFMPLDYDERRDGSFEMDCSGDQVLSAGLFKPSVTFDYLTATPWTTAERLTFNSQSLTVGNGFEQEIEQVMFFKDGVAWSAGPIVSGAQAKFESVPPSDEAGNPGAMYFDAFVRTLPGDQEKEFLKGVGRELRKRGLAQDGQPYYIARLKGAQESEQPGVTMNDGGHTHIIVGLMSHDAAGE